MKNIQFAFIALPILAFLISACSGNNLAPTYTPSSTPTLTVTPSLTSSQIPTSLQTPTPLLTSTLTPTPTPQTLGRIFPDGFSGQAVWTNGGGNTYKDQQWFCGPNGNTTLCTGHVMHFDVSLPLGFTESDKVLSPVDGYIDDIYNPGEGKSIVIIPEPTYAGVPELLNNQERIDTLSKGVFKFDYAISDVKYVSLHLAHVLPLVKIGDRVSRGQPIAKVNFNVPFVPKKVAFVIYIHMKDGNFYHFSPCDVPNEDEFCGKCTPGSPHPCP